MHTRTLKSELEIYLPLLSANQQQLILDIIKGILNINSGEKRVSIKKYNAEIDAAHTEIIKGKGVNHREVLSQSRKWLKRK